MPLKCVGLPRCQRSAAAPCWSGAHAESATTKCTMYIATTTKQHSGNSRRNKFVLFKTFLSYKISNDLDADLMAK